MIKYLVLLVCFLGFRLYTTTYSSVNVNETEVAVKQLSPGYSGDVVRSNQQASTNFKMLINYGFLILGGFFVIRDFKGVWNAKPLILMICGIGLLSNVGCWQPFKPIKLETVGTYEEAFLLPYTGDLAQQTSSNTEEYLTKNLVYAKQVQIPQQWVSTGYETIFWDGDWRDAALLVKVDKSPVTREWTADIKSGTSDKDEAIWVMTADQVEFSTGWTCTARIPSRDDAVKFLHNYPIGSLSAVMDKEIRAKLQAEFAMEVTDLPMEELREKATPHIVKVRDNVKEFFKARGIEITNLGITGGFVYKDPKIKEVLVEVFNSEQKKEIAKAETASQEEQNKQIQLEATGKAEALLKQKTAEAEGIKLVADAKAYEMEKAQANSESYFQLKRLELEKEKLTKWDGRFPSYYMSAEKPEMLLQVPMPNNPTAVK